MHLSVVNVCSDEDNKQQNKDIATNTEIKDMKVDLKKKPTLPDEPQGTLVSYKENTSFLKITKTHKITTLPNCLSTTVQMHQVQSSALEQLLFASKSTDI